MDPKALVRWCEEEIKCCKLGSSSTFYLLKAEATENEDECKSGRLVQGDVHGQVGVLELQEATWWKLKSRKHA